MCEVQDALVVVVCTPEMVSECSPARKWTGGRRWAVC